MRTLRTTAIPVALAVALGACGYEGPPASTEATSEAESSPDAGPPGDADALAELVDPLVEDLGLHFTRGSLTIRDEGYVPSPDGDHLALYVEPIDETSYDADDYAEAIGTLAAAVTPFVFDTYGALNSYDICQEPPPAIDDSEAPAPYTQIDLSRDQYERVDWSSIDTAGVIAESERPDDPVFLHVTEPIEAAETYAAARAEARQSS